jgi:hypothetical protein
MHDETVELRLRAALRDEADRQPFTITAAELERRIAVRSRVSGNVRLTLLVAAAMTLGALGLGGVIGGSLSDADESPPPSRSTEASPGPTIPPDASPGPVFLGSLDEAIDTALGGEVVVAQAHDHVDLGGPNLSGVVPNVFQMSLGTIQGSTRYQLTLVCLGGGTAAVDVRVPASRGPWDGPEVRCDGAHYTQPIAADGPQIISLRAPRLASWRVVIRRLDGDVADPLGSPPALDVPPGHQELLRVEEESTVGGPTWAGSTLLARKAGSVGARWDYLAHAWCAGADAIRLIFGHEVDGGAFVPTTETLVPCDNRAHEAVMGIPEPSGTEVYVAAAPESRWSILVTGLQPPVALAEDLDGWQVVAGSGPGLEFDTTIYSFAGLSVDGGGAFMVVLDCAAPTAPVEVTVHDRGGRDELGSFDAECSPDGTVTSRTFETSSYDGVKVEYEARFGQWTAMSILVPDEAIAP